ncbi:Predicted RNA-binding protein with PUA domain [Phaffia rhodozyma]|uniref:Translation machinery-associated protein 20 n=1 Tax=Phaffia rhodozyma TaxID=264483 RepID=A0A0F7SSB0_PHARH|nr:Predicted RNA-binding protein with PUA domain [Phaffia rhodozyma]
MFEKFTPKEDISGQTSIKSSVQRSIRSKILEQLPLLAEGEGSEEGSLMDALWPKKEGLTLVKCRDHISIYALNGEPLFFQHFDGPYFPTLRILHKYPELLPHVKIDRGAIRFLLAGANMMAPGLTSPGGSLPPKDLALPKETPVAIFAEGKEFAVGMGTLEMGTEDIKKINKGIAVNSVHYLGDGLWKHPTF